LFSGEYIHKVDTKRRINIPATVISEISREYEYSKDSDFTFHIVPGPNDCLFVYPREMFAQIAENLEKKYGSLGLNEEDEDEIEGKRFFTWLMGQAKPLTCDQQGRIIVSDDHLEYAGISVEGKVVIIGTGNKLEFWNPDRHEKFLEGGKYSKKDLVKRFGRADRG
jgi:division/cell wall cluster transcriptional repressor MraZ